MALEPLERFGIVTGAVLGVIGCFGGIAGWMQSREALELSRATARPYLQVVGARFTSAPIAGQYVRLELEVKNFGQVEARSAVIRVTEDSSGGKYEEWSADPQIESLAPGNSRVVNLVTEGIYTGGFRTPVRPRILGYVTYHGPESEVTWRDNFCLGVGPDYASDKEDADRLVVVPC